MPGPPQIPETIKPKYGEETVHSWSELREILDGKKFRSWAFRGQTNAEWGLESSLTRHLKAARVDRDHWPDQEERILRIFRRKSHLYLNLLPNPRDSFQWLALMQHHGAPTRLIDFTWSPYVATFYALARPLACNDAAIWALNQRELNKKHEDKAPWYLGNYEKYFLPNRHPIVLLGEPHHMNQRLIAHSGTFAIPGKIDISAEALIAESGKTDAICKIYLKNANEFRRSALDALYRMNITWATLFPDLDGLGKSMQTELELHWDKDVTQPKQSAAKNPIRNIKNTLQEILRWSGGRH